jgi:hypothetical protein
MSPDLLSTLRSELDARLHELRRLRYEYEHLLAEAEALGCAPDRAAPPPAAEKTSSTTRISRARPQGRRAPAEAIDPSSSNGTSSKKGPRKLPRARPGTARHAILAALERGPHTTSELLSIAGFAEPNIRYNLQRMLCLRTISRTERSGRTVWHALPGADQRIHTTSVEQARTNGN